MIPPPPPPLPPPPPGGLSAMENGVLRPGPGLGRPEPPGGPGPNIPAEIPSIALTFLDVMNTITNLLLGAVAIFAIIIAVAFLEEGTNTISNHIFLCVTGYVIMMSQAIHSLNSRTGWGYSARNKKAIHWTLQIIGSTLAIAGSITIISDSNIEHFQTGHGVLGLVAMILTILSLFGGVVNLISSSKEKQAHINLVYVCFGSLTLATAFINLCLAFDKNIYRLAFGDTNANLAIVVTIFALAGTLTSTILNNFNSLLRSRNNCF